MQAAAPPQVFAGMMGLAQSVIARPTTAQVATRRGRLNTQRIVLSNRQRTVTSL